MNKEDKGAMIVAGILLLTGFSIGAGVGVRVGTYYERNQAIKAGAASYELVNHETGETEFRYKGKP